METPFEERAFKGLEALIDSLRSRTGRWLVTILLTALGWAAPAYSKGIKALIDGGSFDDFGQLLFGTLALIAGARAFWTNANRQWAAATKPVDPKMVEKPGFAGEKGKLLPTIIKQRALPKSAPPPEFAEFVADRVTVSEAPEPDLPTLPAEPIKAPKSWQAAAAGYAREANVNSEAVAAYVDEIYADGEDNVANALKMVREFIKSLSAPAALLAAALCLASCQQSKDFVGNHEIGAAINIDAWEVILNHKPYKLVPIQK